MESTLGNAGAKLKRIEEEYRRRMEEEMDKNKKLFAELTATRDEMEKKGELILQRSLFYRLSVYHSICTSFYLFVCNCNCN